MPGSRIVVEAGDSWKQPDADKVLGDSEEKNELQDIANTTSEPPSNALNLLSLNDDCLEIICGVLELRDQVNFARVCPRFNDVFKMFCKRKYKAFDLSKSFDLLEMSSMTLLEIRDFFRFSGEYIEEVAINSANKKRNHITEFIGLFCKNLTRIALIDIELQPDALNKLLRSFPKLVELRLFDCDLNDTTVKSLLHLKNLDTLVIENDCLITGKFLSGLSQLKKLSLYFCQNIETKNLIKICEAMKNLKSLDVRGCESLTSDFFETMADQCLELEALKMSCPHFSIDCVARLPCLKQLELSGIITFDSTLLLTTLLTELVAHKADQLESLSIRCIGFLTADQYTAISQLKQLKIFSYIGSLCDEALRKLSKLELLEELVIKCACYIGNTNEALLRLLQNCTRLHLLDIDYCVEISTQFIAEAIAILKNRKEKSKKPLTIFAYGTSIEEFALAKAYSLVRKQDIQSFLRALVHSKHQMPRSRIVVEAGDSWKQPDAGLGDSEEKNELQDITNTTSEPPSNALTLLSLNDDCLEIICGVLELRDQVNFARVCPRFNDVFKMFCKRKYKVFDLSKSFDLLEMSSMTLLEIRDFFRFSGEYIEEVAINSANKKRNHITEFIGLFCKNLTRIALIDIELQPDALNKLLRSFPKLVELRLFDCDLNDTTVKSLLHLKNLDTLVIENDCLITGKFLSGLSQLKKLSLYFCQNIETKNLIKICEAMKNLKSLDVRGCESLTSDFFETMADQCLELEALKMSCPHFSIDCVARLPCLKQLELSGIITFDSTLLLTTLLTELVAHKADQLESLSIRCIGFLTADQYTAISQLKQLKIFSYIGSLCDEALRKLSKLELLEELVIKCACYIGNTNEALLRLLQNCTRLHLLDIDYCVEISTQFIAEAIAILKNRKEKSKKPLTIFAYGTSIEEFALAKAYSLVRKQDIQSFLRALVHSKHQMPRSRIVVEAGDSWKQPDAGLGDSEEKNELQDITNTTSEPPSNALTLLSLNDDCLEIICGVLELRDQVNFARVCPRFNDVFKMFCKRKYKVFDLLKMSSLTLLEIRDFLRFSGEYIEDVILHPAVMKRNRITEFIRLFCKNLKRIALIHIELEPDALNALNKLLRNFPKLVELRLFHCDLNDTTVKLLHLKNLDTLVIEDNGLITGKFLSGLSQLKKLSLYFCENIETKNLIKICEAMKNLKSLDVRGCKVTSDFFETMADHCLDLEDLKMSCPDFSFDCVARLPCLKQLELSGITTFSSTLLTTLLTKLVAHKADQLESLKCLGSLTVDHFTAISELKQLKIFYCNNPIGDEALRKLSKLKLLEEIMMKRAYNITNEALLRLLQNCTRLHLLYIERCMKISTRFVVEAIDILKNRKEKSKKPLTIFAYGTSIEEFALAKCPIYESALKSGIIKVVFLPYETEEDYYGYGTSN